MQLKEYLSLCGPSIERIYEESGEPVYDIEITTNRPDAMSVFGVAREASVILPRFGIKAELLNDPYTEGVKSPKTKGDKKLSITTDHALNPRWTSVVLSNVQVKESPAWLSDWLTKTGIRPINTIVDATNYLMHAYGQPAHAFDYDRIAKHTMKLRASKKDEKLTTLDGKLHVLPGEDIVIEDGAGRLIDLCGIMGGENSSITKDTKNVVLFLQTYDPSHIRRTSMKLAHRTQAAGLFEKGVDSALVMPALLVGISLIKEIAGGEVASHIYDLYPKPYKPYAVTVRREKVDSYIGTSLSDKEILAILTSLGFKPTVTKTDVTVLVPSFRRDVTIDVDIIEEIARIYGYHTIKNRLPEGEVPSVIPDETLVWEKNLKMLLKDWGYTELLTYSMISQSDLELFGFDPKIAYKLTNPLSEDWVYLRPHAIATTLPAFIGNLSMRKDFKAFELSMSYIYRTNELPLETPVLNVLWAGEHFLQAKGLAESIFARMGIDFDDAAEKSSEHESSRYTDVSMKLGDYASVGILDPSFIEKLGTKVPITRLYINIAHMVRDAHPHKQYIPIPKHPPSVEDLSFVVPDKFAVGPLITALKHADAAVFDVTLFDVHESTRTLHITYQDAKKTLTSDEISVIRQKLLRVAKKKFNLDLR